MGDGPLPLSGADRDSIAGESAGGARGQYDSIQFSKGVQGLCSQLQLGFASKRVRLQSVFTGEKKFVSALEGKKHESNDFLALFPTGLGKATKSR